MKTLKLFAGDCEVENVEGSTIHLKIIDAAVHSAAAVDILVRKECSSQMADKIGSLATAACHVTRQFA